MKKYEINEGMSTHKIIFNTHYLVFISISYEGGEKFWISLSDLILKYFCMFSAALLSIPFLYAFI